jgi:hypothetical protein
MLEVRSKESFNIVFRNVAEKMPFVIHTRGQRKIVIANDKPVAIYQKTITEDILSNRKEAKQIMSIVRKSATKYIKNHLGDIPTIPRLCPVTFNNIDLWEEMGAGEEFYLIDASHCYWRVAYILGYISKNVYEKYAENKELKTLKNISLSILSSTIKREYYQNGEKYLEIESDITDYKKIYNNIRHYAYNNSGEVKDAIPDFCIAYRVDGVYLLREGLKRAKAIFDKNNLLYKVTKCVKIDEKNYSNEDGEVKKIF